ncbi:hypothetical protein ONZ45_g12552 [Pleurotus djamor]|nr:hypothetical protein ONZ45_g12552 [Pleurotus djamor]
MLNLPFLKAVLVFSNALAFHWTAAPLKTAVVGEECWTKGMFEQTLGYQLFFLRIFVWITAVMETALSLRELPVSTGNIGGLPPAMVVGAIMCISGSLLRHSCLKTMGKMLDFKFRAHADRKLIISGPYKYARHPSYTGWFSMIIGVTLAVLAPESSLNGYGAPHMHKAVAGVQAVLTIAMLSIRMHAEEQGLRETFGKEWDKFAEKVPYYLVPGIH